MGDRVDSDFHHPVEVWLEDETNRKRRRGISRKCWTGVWRRPAGTKKAGGNLGAKWVRRKLETGRRELDED